MQSWDDLLTLCQDLSSDTTMDTFFKGRMNSGYHLILSELGSFWTETKKKRFTKASKQEYQLPVQYLKLKSLTVTVGSVVYTPIEVEDQELWNQLNATYTGNSDIAQFYFLKKTSVELFPIPASAGNTITYVFEIQDKDLSASDYTTGKVLELKNNSTNVIGTASTVWTNSMVGRYFKIDSDGNWYRIASRTDNTHITLEKTFEGTTIDGTAGAYTIAEMPQIPEEGYDLIVYFALAHYYAIKKDKENQVLYWGLFTVGPAGRDKQGQALGGLEGLKRRWKRKSTTGIIRGKSNLRKNVRLRNPNLYPTGLS